MRVALISALGSMVTLGTQTQQAEPAPIAAVAPGDVSLELDPNG